MYRSALALAEVGADRVAGRYSELAGRAVPFERWADVGWFMESHARGSLATSTKNGAGKKLPLLWAHDNRSLPLGHVEEWENTDDGLWGTWRLNDRPETQEVARAVDRGDLFGLSIGFAPIRSDWAYVAEWAPDLGPEHKDRVTRQESRLLEVAMVRSAFNIQTRAAMTPKRPLAVDAWREEVERLRSRQP
jgi:hypothetical protein